MMKNNYCTFYLVRHGETEWNKKELIQGQSDSPLTKNGIKQAKKLGKVLANIKFNHVFSSDLLRAHRTAQLIVLNRKLVIKTTKLLRERFFGPYEGKKFSKVQKEIKALIFQMKQLAEKQNLSGFKKIIESDSDLVSRLINFLREIAVAYPGKKILVVTHGGILRVFLQHLGFAKPHQLPPGSIANSSYIFVESDGVDFFLKETYGIVKKTDV